MLNTDRFRHVCRRRLITLNWLSLLASRQRATHAAGRVPLAACETNTPAAPLRPGDHTQQDHSTHYTWLISPVIARGGNALRKLITYLTEGITWIFFAHITKVFGEIPREVSVNRRICSLCVQLIYSVSADISSVVMFRLYQQCCDVCSQLQSCKVFLKRCNTCEPYNVLFICQPQGQPFAIHLARCWDKKGREGRPKYLHNASHALSEFCRAN